METQALEFLLNLEDLAQFKVVIIPSADDAFGYELISIHCPVKLNDSDVAFWVDPMQFHTPETWDTLNMVLANLIDRKLIMEAISTRMKKPAAFKVVK